MLGNQSSEDSCDVVDNNHLIVFVDRSGGKWALMSQAHFQTCFTDFGLGHIVPSLILSEHTDLYTDEKQTWTQGNTGHLNAKLRPSNR